MTDFGLIADGKTPESSDVTANYGYTTQPPDVATAHKAMFDMGGNASDAITSGASQGIANVSSYINNQPKLSADEINKQYAPTGPDGKPVKITDAPMYAASAQIVAQRKAQEIDREAILSREYAAHDTVGNFALDMAAFLHDPLNVATMLIPPVGEAGVLARFGQIGMATEGVAAKAGARFIAGGATGAVAMAPLAAIKYGIGTQQASDYDLRSALTSVIYGAAGGAVLHAGFGAIGDAWKASKVKSEVTPMELPDDQKGIESQIINADLQTKNAAMRSATSQVLDGREVSVDPLFPKEGVAPTSLDEVAMNQKEIYKEGYAPGLTHEDVAQSMDNVFNPKEDVTDHKVEIVQKPVEMPKPAEPSPIAQTQPSESLPKNLSGAKPNEIARAIEEFTGRDTGGGETAGAVGGEAVHAGQLGESSAAGGRITGGAESPAGIQYERPEHLEGTSGAGQAVIPGAGKVSEGEIAQRGTEAPLKSSEVQKDPNEGLFDTGSRYQTDLLKMEAIQSKLDITTMTAEEHAALNTASKVYDDALENLRAKKQALDDCLAATGA